MKRGSLFHALQTRFRSRRFLHLLEIINESLKLQARVVILDVGGRPQYWSNLPSELRSKVHVICLNFASELALYKSTDPDISIEMAAGDACNMPQYVAGQFDIVHSNSVIEHVGSYANMQKFADEVRRVGKNYYVQTPNYWFPIEPHYGVPFFHWLPDMARMWLFTKIRIGYAHKCSPEQAQERIDHTRMIGRSLLTSLFPDATIIAERFMLLRKSNTAIRKNLN
jgi:hypothetical protein